MWSAACAQTHHHHIPKQTQGQCWALCFCGAGKGLVITRADLLCIKASGGKSAITALVIEKNGATKLEKSYWRDWPPCAIGSTTLQFGVSPSKVWGQPWRTHSHQLLFLRFRIISAKIPVIVGWDPCGHHLWFTFAWSTARKSERCFQLQVFLAGVTKTNVLWIFIKLAERQGPTGKRKAAFIWLAFPGTWALCS